MVEKGVNGHIVLIAVQQEAKGLVFPLAFAVGRNGNRATALFVVVDHAVDVDGKWRRYEVAVAARRKRGARSRAAQHATTAGSAAR